MPAAPGQFAGDGVVPCDRRRVACRGPGSGGRAPRPVEEDGPPAGGDLPRRPQEGQAVEFLEPLDVHGEDLDGLVVLEVGEVVADGQVHLVAEGDGVLRVEACQLAHPGHGERAALRHERQRRHLACRHRQLVLGDEHRVVAPGQRADPQAVPAVDQRALPLARARRGERLPHPRHDLRPVPDFSSSPPGITMMLSAFLPSTMSVIAWGVCAAEMARMNRSTRSGSDAMSGTQRHPASSVLPGFTT